MARIIQYIKDTRGEMRHVSWPTQTQTLIYTALVVAISLLTAMYLGFFDFVFTSSLNEGLDAIVPGQGASIPADFDTPTNNMPAGGEAQPAFDLEGAEAETAPADTTGASAEEAAAGGGETADE